MDITAALSQVNLIPESALRARLPDRWARLPDHRETHLLCCVFLI
jgi:hypothetical protein